MTNEEVEKLIEFGKAINIKVTPIQIGNEIGVHYLDFESFNYVAVLRDLVSIRDNKEERS